MTDRTAEAERDAPGAVDIPRIDELGGYVSMARAMELTGYSTAAVRVLATSGAIKAAKWDDRTIIFHRRSLERYLEHRGRGPYRQRRQQETQAARG